MKNYQSFFRGKKVTVMGLGLLGRGVNDAKFLAECGAELVVTDLKTRAQLKDSLQKLRDFKNICYTLGKHRLEDFRKKDFILKAAGVPLDSPYIMEAKKNDIPIEMDASLFAKLSSAKIIGITGTRGKSTTTHLIFNILKAAKKRVFLGGNIRGMATLPLLKKVKEGDWVVMELDSWQLQGFGDAKISPHIAVFTNFLLDHQNYYHGSMDRYFQDKSYIYQFQKSEDFCITSPKAAQLIRDKRFPRRGRLVEVEETLIPPDWNLKILGNHNRKNVAYAITAVRLIKIPEKIIKNTVEKFSGIPGRLELIRTVNGVAYINDTTATTPDGLRAALQSFPDINRTVLIAGGADKQLEYQPFIEEVNKVKKLILLAGTATDKMVKLLPKRNKMIVVNSMKEAVIQAQRIAAKGDTVLLSPGAASFGLFKNEFDRGEQFIKEVKKIKKAA
ncbi:MAG TPA: UDP-N-acetylmuramoyl-L-alanine--D-glutamate ligase [Candidatus Paceibacterota bacterium]